MRAGPHVGRVTSSAVQNLIATLGEEVLPTPATVSVGRYSESGRLHSCVIVMADQLSTAVLVYIPSYASTFRLRRVPELTAHWKHKDEHTHLVSFARRPTEVVYALVL